MSEVDYGTHSEFRKIKFIDRSGIRERASGKALYSAAEHTVVRPRIKMSLHFGFPNSTGII